jgi:ribosomal protein L13E
MIMPSQGFSSVAITNAAKRKLIMYKADLEKRHGRIFTLSEVIETALDAVQADIFEFLDSENKETA